MYSYQDVPCQSVQAGDAVLHCDDQCKALKQKREKEQAESERQKEEEEKRRWQQELQEFERKVGGKRRKPRKVAVNDDQDHPWWKQQSWLIVIGSVLFILGSLVLYMYMVE